MVSRLLPAARRSATTARTWMRHVLLRLRPTRIPNGAKLHVGCGNTRIPGYYGCDLRPLPTVDIVCKAWSISRYCRNVGEIYSRHMLEHLTWLEAEHALRDWHNALQPGGRVHIVVPNLDFALEQWQQAEWTDEAWNAKWSNTRWGVANLFGWQRECDPAAAEYNNSYWDVHKSGYNARAMRFLLRKTGFVDIQISFDSFTEEQMQQRRLPPRGSDRCHLVAKAVKPDSAAITGHFEEKGRCTALTEAPGGVEDHPIGRPPFVGTAHCQFHDCKYPEPLP